GAVSDGWVRRDLRDGRRRLWERHLAERPLGPVRGDEDEVLPPSGAPAGNGYRQFVLGGADGVDAPIAGDGDRPLLGPADAVGARPDGDAAVLRAEQPVEIAELHHSADLSGVTQADRLSPLECPGDDFPFGPDRKSGM